MNFAGFGTDHVGFGTCKFHGGSTASHRKAAVKEASAARLPTFGKPSDVAPDIALLQEVQRTAGHVEWLSHQVTEDDTRTFEGRVLLQLYQSERAHLVRAAKAAVDSGVAERQVRIAQQQGQLLAAVILTVLRELHLSQTEFDRARSLAADQLRALDATTTAGSAAP